MNDVPVVYIEVHGQRYPIRTRLEPRYVQDLAHYVDRKMRAAVEASPSSDGVGLAVLTALNIADEFFRSRDERSDEASSLTSRAQELERIVDQALESAGLSLLLQQEDGVDRSGAPGRPPNGGKGADAEGEPRP
jgi:cell division protein ZapA